MSAAATPSVPPSLLWAVRAVVVLGGIALFAAVTGHPASSSTTGDVELGRQLYTTACVSCHGTGGDGVEGRGPSLLDQGAAGTDFVLRTGRMPLSEPTRQGVRSPVRYSEEEIRGLVAYVAQLPGQTGPDIPDPDVEGGSVPNGGAIFRTNCATCHQAAGQGGTLVASQVPGLSQSTPVQIVEAMLVGPGAMPVFSELSEDDVDDVVAYIVSLQEQPNPGGFGVGRTGPFAEGLVAWGGGLLALILFTRWVGTRMR